MPQAPVELTEMSGVEFEAMRPGIVEAYAKDRSRNLGTTMEEETEVARRQLAATARKIKSGKTRAFFIRSGRTKVGYLIFTYEKRRRYAYLEDIEVFEAHRRKGYARAALRLLEGLATSQGARTIGLNVFGDNLPARSLYEKSGYWFAFHGMRKRL